MIASGGADMVAFGQAWIANPDLDRRFREGWDVNRPDPASYYMQGAEGYCDYPTYERSDRSALSPVDSTSMALTAAAA